MLVYTASKSLIMLFDVISVYLHWFKDKNYKKVNDTILYVGDKSKSYKTRKYLETKDILLN